MKSEPVFRVDTRGRKPKVFLKCSNCGEDIRRLKPKESISVNRGYYCDECDDGAIHLNMPKEE